VKKEFCQDLLVHPGFFFKENVRYPVGARLSDFRDPIFSDSRNPMIIFADSRDPNWVPKTP